MADFCQAHSIELFGEDFKELAGLSTPEDTAKGLYARCICESCGLVLVDHEGKTVQYLTEPALQHRLPNVPVAPAPVVPTQGV